MITNFLVTNRVIILYILIAISLFIRVIISNETVFKLFNLNIKKEKKIELFLIQSIGLILIERIFKLQLRKIIEIIYIIFLYVKLLNLKIEKAAFAEEINIILICISEALMAKIGIVIFNISTMPNEVNMIIYKVSMSITPIIWKVILYNIIKKKKLVINLNDCINIKEKVEMIVIISCSLILTEATENQIISNIQEIPSVLFWITNGLLISYFIVVIGSIFKISKINDATIQIENLEGSNERLQDNYDNIRSFRHDFNNIMQSIGGYIAIKDIGGLEKMYKSIIKECQDINNSQGINKEIINNPAVYNLINIKYKIAQSLEIKMKIEVLIDLNNLKIDDYDLCRILGILLDNAIEAAKDCEEKIISIKFIKDKLNNRDLIIIENPCKNYLIDVNKLFQKGFSSKKDKVCHGLGLWKVKQILKKNKNLQIYTARDQLFKQQLEIY